ncbi:MAG: hypothetical protein ACYDHN_00345 [Solirubrobacteraceae bacterium]
MTNPRHTTERAAQGDVAEALWIFGDNILECEKALGVVAEAVGPPGAELRWVGGALYAPLYELRNGREAVLTTQLFPGYKRWNYDLQLQLRQRGAPLLEGTDAVVVNAADSEVLLAFEFCGALPAGNNAWQRCGRALACAAAGVPYLYYAELGGLELHGNRAVKAARFPNPLVPFAYLSLSQLSNSLAAPVFVVSPTATPDIACQFAHSSGDREALAVTRDVLAGEHDRAGTIVAALQQKAEQTVEALTARRHRTDTLTANEWLQLSNTASGRARADWLLNRAMPWRKRESIGTQSFRELLTTASAIGLVAAGAEGIPISLLPACKRPQLTSVVNNLYGSRVSGPFGKWLVGDEERPLVIVWIAGFKPAGQDSRPDRGLLPLARMLFGDGVDYLSVIYGPARASQLDELATNIVGLARSNGLWEAVVGLSDAILVDSRTSGAMPSVGVLAPYVPPESTVPATPFDPTLPPLYGEHDIDTILHMLFATAPHIDVFEGMCNPPGGNWSGISFQSTPTADVVRWSSLPRVPVGVKRPDHVVVFQGATPTVLSVESKHNAGSVETGVGPRLTAYVDNLFQIEPTISRAPTVQAWRSFAAVWSPRVEYLSAVAYQYQPTVDPQVVRTRSGADIVLAIEFLGDSGKCLLHASGTLTARNVLSRVRQCAARFGDWLEVQEH